MDLNDNLTFEDANFAVGMFCRKREGIRVWEQVLEGLEFRSCKHKEIPRREWSCQEQKDHKEVKKDKDEKRGKYYYKLEVGQQDHMALLFHLQTADRSEDGERKMPLSRIHVMKFSLLF